jgi:N-acyl-D-aspartate/D-glutamate deacylase
MTSALDQARNAYDRPGTEPMMGPGGERESSELDLVIQNGTVVDGTGGPASIADVGVRDGRITLPDAVRALTDIPAQLYGLHGRGRVAPGYQADLIVFDETTVGPGRVHLRSDLPAGASRLYAEARGVEHVMVNGVDIVAAGEVTGARPGTVLWSGRDTQTVLAR